MDATTRTFFVAGVQHRPTDVIVSTKDWLRHATAKDFPVPLKLVGEPSNKYDRYAVKVVFSVIVTDAALEAHTGYIPKPINIDVWSLRDAGYKPSARLVEFNPDGPPWQMFKVEVTFTK